MASHTGSDEVGEEGITRLIKGRADTGEHLLTDVTELAFGSLEGQLFHLGLADVTRLVPHRGRLWRRRFRSVFDKCCFIHREPIYHNQKICQLRIFRPVNTMYKRLCTNFKKAESSCWRV
jgi:hypothetical protein